MHDQRGGVCRGVDRRAVFGGQVQAQVEHSLDTVCSVCKISHAQIILIFIWLILKIPSKLTFPTTAPVPSRFPAPTPLAQWTEIVQKYPPRQQRKQVSIISHRRYVFAHSGFTPAAVAEMQPTQGMLVNLKDMDIALGHLG